MVTIERTAVNMPGIVTGKGYFAPCFGSIESAKKYILSNVKNVNALLHCRRADYSANYKEFRRMTVISYTFRGIGVIPGKLIYTIKF